MKKHSIPITPAQKNSMVKQIRTRRSWKIDKISSRKSVHLVELSPGEVVQAVYSKRYHKVMAVYPTDIDDDVYGGWAA